MGGCAKSFTYRGAYSKGRKTLKRWEGLGLNKSFCIICLSSNFSFSQTPDTSNVKLQINFSCLMSKYFIWACKVKNETPSLSHFLRLLKKTHEIETKEKMETSP